MHISIEGMDGVGKTTICKLLAEKINYKFVEKPLHYIFDENESEVFNYRKISKKINEIENKDFTAWYYGLNNIYLYEKFKNSNIITDRHIVSNYCWSGTKQNEDIYDLIINKIGKPFVTVILYAKPEVILSRLKSRNINDPDTRKVSISEKNYHKMIKFCKLKKFNYILIDTSYKSADEVVTEIFDYLKEHK